MITHDKRGNPLHPMVQQVLNLEVPVKPKRRRTASMRQQRPRVALSEVPCLSEVPSLEIEPDAQQVQAQQAQAQQAQAQQAQAQQVQAQQVQAPTYTKAERAEEAELETAKRKLSASPPKALAWLFSFLSKEQGPQVIEEKPLETNVQLDFPQRTGCAVPEPEPLRRESLLMNSAFYRVLALETQMCQRGKLEAPSVRMAIPRQRQPPKPRVWADLAAT